MWPMSEKLKLSLRCPPIVFGSQVYTIIIDVTNVCDKPLSGINVEPQVVPGTVLAVQDSPARTDRDELGEKKFKLLRELQIQIVRAYRSQARKDTPGSRSTLLSAILRVYGISEEPGAVPYWAREALRIEDWSDLERLEKDIMSAEPDNSFLRRAFNRTKAKLETCLQKEQELNERGRQIPLNPDISIQPGETVPFVFRCRAPHAYRQSDGEAQFKVSYKDLEKGTTGVYSCAQALRLHASFFAVPVGALLGALAGYIIKLAYIGPPPTSWQQGALYGLACCLLALVVGLLTGRSSESRKAITVEDFVGGFVIGAVCGLFTENLINYLRGFIPKPPVQS